MIEKAKDFRLWPFMLALPVPSIRMTSRYPHVPRNEIPAKEAASQIQAA